MIDLYFVYSENFPVPVPLNFSIEYSSKSWDWEFYAHNISSLTFSISEKYEQELVIKQTLMRENSELKHKVDELQRHLASYQRQISESQTQLHLLEEQVTKIQHDKAQNKVDILHFL